MLDEVVRGIGSPNFSHTLFSCLNSAIGVRRVLIYRYVRSGEVEVLAAEGVDEAVRNRVSQYHLLDPTRRCFPCTPQREMSVEFLAADDIADEAFRSWWRRHDLGSRRAAVLVRRPDDVQVIDMFLGEQGDGGEPEHNYIVANAPAISSAVERHFELLEPPRPPSLADWTERLKLIPCPTPLSTREALVCAHILRGYSNEAMALDIGISLHSVVTYRKRAYAKLRISSQNELFSLFFPGGMLASAVAASPATASEQHPAPFAGGGYVSPKRAIRELLHNYCRALHYLDVPLGRAVWHEDGMAIYDGHFEGTGRQFWDWIAASYPNRAELLHRLGETTIDVKGQYASSETRVSLVRLRLHREKPQLFTAHGRYLDSWSRRNGNWGLEKRHYVRDVEYMQDIQADNRTGL